MAKSILAAAIVVGASARNATDVPMWGCGLLGAIPGITGDGTASADALKMINGLKSTTPMNKVSYWNWNLAPMLNDDGTMQWLTKDFLFMPEQWGMQAAEDKYVREANKADFLDSEGQRCPATMADIFLGGNEPDIIGSCMGNMMGRCTGSCTEAEVRSGCPVAYLDGPLADPLPNGHCDCWSHSHATGVGYWPFTGCSDPQPLPKLFDGKDPACVDGIMEAWRENAAIISKKGYKYLTTPLMAVNIDWMHEFVRRACDGCSDVSCGCPTHLAWHFYGNDCQPITNGDYDMFEKKLAATAKVMEAFPHLMGTIINEVGMLNCDMSTPDAECVPNGPTQKYPAIKQPNNQCPKTDEMPNGFGTFIEELLKRVMKSKTQDGRPTVAGFSWFNENMAGGTYNLQLFDKDGSVNYVGDAYIKACNTWATSRGF